MVSLQEQLNEDKLDMHRKLARDKHYYRSPQQEKEEKLMVKKFAA